MGFRSKVIKIALFVLLIYAIVLSIILHTSHSSLAWPPEISKCPDNWTYIAADETDEEKCKIGANQLNIGDPEITLSPTNTYEIANMKPEGTCTGKCGQKKWALKHNIIWSGISDADYSVLNCGAGCTT
tara:strand:- start:1147 stop:1533 length:387 start_codon:yes stop_codon:yes gene_type:complete